MKTAAARRMAASRHPGISSAAKRTRSEIARIVEMGVNIKCNCEVGGSLSLAQLKAEYRAVLMTVGMSCGSDLPLFEQASHVEIAVDFYSAPVRPTAILAFRVAH